MPQADSDDHLVSMWVERSSSEHTRGKYRAEAARLMAFVGKPLPHVRIGDLQVYLVSLEGKASATRANATATIKSLFSFAQEVGYVLYNVGKAVKAPPVKNTLAERILSEPDAQRMVLLEPNLRNRALLTRARTAVRRGLPSRGQRPRCPNGQARGGDRKRFRAPGEPDKT